MPPAPSHLETTPHARGRSNRSANSHTTCYDYVYRAGDRWITEQISVQELCDKQGPPPEIQIMFLPEVADVVRFGWHSRLSDCFKVPWIFWGSMAQSVSGFLGCQETTDTSTRLTYFSSSFCFLVKDPVKSTRYLKLDDPSSVKVSYMWHTMAFHTIWAPSKHLVVLCFGLPAPMKCSLSNLGRLCLDDSLSFHAILTEKVASLYDASLWSWRDIVRDIEKNRISIQDPRPDYVSLHELARHTIHSSEMLAVAAETIANLVQEHEIFLNDNASLVASTTLSRQTMRTLRSHIALLKSLHLRSKALEDRLRNEINLAFNTVAQHDSRITVQIGRATQIDSAAMKTISVLGLVFLPGTFICALFSTSFFNFSPGTGTDPQHWTVSEKFWIYWAVAIPLTATTVVCWLFWQRLYGSFPK